MDQELNPEFEAHLEGIVKELSDDFYAIEAEAKELIQTKPETPEALDAIEKRLKEGFEVMKERYMTKLAEVDQQTKSRLEKQWELVYDDYHSLLLTVMNESAKASGEMKST